MSKVLLSFLIFTALLFADEQFEHGKSRPVAPLTKESLNEAIAAFELQPPGIFHRLMNDRKFDEAFIVGSKYYDIIERARQEHLFEQDFTHFLSQRTMAFLGQAYEKKGNFLKAIKLFEREAKLKEQALEDPKRLKENDIAENLDRSFCYDAIARNKYQLGLIPEAIEYYRKALSCVPQEDVLSRITSHDSLGHVLIDAGASQQALKELKAARELVPQVKALPSEQSELEGVKLSTRLGEARALISSGKLNEAEVILLDLRRAAHITKFGRQVFFRSLVALADLEIQKAQESQSPEEIERHADRARGWLTEAQQIDRKSPKNDHRGFEYQIALARAISYKELARFHPMKSPEVFTVAEQTLGEVIEEVEQSEFGFRNPWIAAKAHQAYAELERIRFFLDKKPSRLKDAFSHLEQTLRILDIQTKQLYEKRELSLHSTSVSQRNQVFHELLSVAAKLPDDHTKRLAEFNRGRSPITDATERFAKGNRLESVLRHVGPSGALIEIIKHPVFDFNPHGLWKAMGETYDLFVTHSFQPSIGQVEVARIPLGDASRLDLAVKGCVGRNSEQVLECDQVVFDKILRPAIEAKKFRAAETYYYSADGQLGRLPLEDTKVKLDPPIAKTVRIGDILQIKRLGIR